MPSPVCRLEFAEVTKTIKASLSSSFLTHTVGLLQIGWKLCAGLVLSSPRDLLEQPLSEKPTVSVGEEFNKKELGEAWTGA